MNYTKHPSSTPLSPDKQKSNYDLSKKLKRSTVR